MMLTFLVVAILAISNALYLEVPSGKKRVSKRWSTNFLGIMERDPLCYLTAP